jgi:hypothetical protein
MDVVHFSVIMTITNFWMRLFSNSDYNMSFVIYCILHINQFNEIFMLL